MTLNLKKHKDDLLFLPLGGAGEIGMNLNLYHLDGKWLMVDFGAGFAEEYLPGVDMIVPDIDFILKHKKDLLGLVLTHAHEDHQGAIVHMWDEFDCPIYATKFTAAFLKNKIADNKLVRKPKIIEVKEGERFKVGPFDIEMTGITHSVPEMNGLMIRTKHGNIFHSGDWKFDPDPMIGNVSDIKKLQSYGKEGVLAMVSDSTNIFSPGTSGSEGKLRESLIDIIGGCEQLVVVTTFASNVARLESIAKAAEACGRQVVLAGRSLWRIVDAAKESGYLKDCPKFFEDSHLRNTSRDKILVVSTGCQGEPMAATNKIVSGTHKTIRLNPNDTIIFSSKIIPGNDKRIFRMFNKLVKMEIEVITERDHFVHVSGHPNRDEVKRMYDYIKPEIAIPVHGEDCHMHEHAKLAEEMGVKQSFKMENGLVLKLGPGAPEKVAMVESGILAIDGNFLLPPDSSIMRMRRKLQREGIIVITLLMDKSGLKKDAIIFAPGVLDDQEDSDIFVAMQEEIQYALDDYFNSVKSNKISFDRIENLARSATRRIIRPETAKNPPILVHIEKI